ncbi:hypothetical protein V6N13_147012 [Hibiscus sabdariffa]
MIWKKKEGLLWWSIEKPEMLVEGLKLFYKKWYHLHNTKVIAVGDFPDTQKDPSSSSFSFCSTVIEIVNENRLQEQKKTTQILELLN